MLLPCTKSKEIQNLIWALNMHGSKVIQSKSFVMPWLNVDLPQIHPNAELQEIISLLFQERDIAVPR